MPLFIFIFYFEYILISGKYTNPRWNNSTSYFAHAATRAISRTLLNTSHYASIDLSVLIPVRKQYVALLNWAMPKKITLICKDFLGFELEFADFKAAAVSTQP